MNPLYLTAHYDDLEICAGGTASRYGGTSIVLYSKSDYGKENEGQASAAILGTTSIEAEHYIGERDLVAYVDKHITDNVDTIVSTSPYDSHPEHQQVAALAQQVARKNNINLWYMDHAITGGYTNSPRPNRFVNTTMHGVHKRAAIRCYKAALATYGPKWIQTIKARDEYYGAIHGTAEAEGFITVNTIQ